MEHQTPSVFPGNFRKRKVLGTLCFPFCFPENLVQPNSCSAPPHNVVVFKKKNRRQWAKREPGGSVRLAGWLEGCIQDGSLGYCATELVACAATAPLKMSPPWQTKHPFTAGGPNNSNGAAQ